LKKLLKKYRQQNKPCFVFSPTIANCEELYSLSFFARAATMSTRNGLGEKRSFRDFKKGQVSLFGHHFGFGAGRDDSADLQVIVVGPMRKRSIPPRTLIQIAGRAGRKSDAPDGEGDFLGEKETEEMHDAIKEIAFCNTFL
jgi:late competence protein required for DNA uptake (superfamily II DNA/RNA helicase)